MKLLTLIFFPCLITLLCLLNSCDSHHLIEDTNVRVGDIVCTDGSVVTVKEFIASDKEAIAVVFHTPMDEDELGYAVYLHDLPELQFSDTLGIRQDTSADLLGLDGNVNTFALYSCGNASSPLAKEVFAMWKYGQSAYVPSPAQCRMLYENKSTVNATLSLIGGEPLPDTADDCWYWTSTEVEAQEEYKAWLYSIGSGAMQETPKTQAHKARSVITLYN